MWPFKPKLQRFTAEEISQALARHVCGELSTQFGPILVSIRQSATRLEDALAAIGLEQGKQGEALGNQLRGIVQELADMRAVSESRLWLMLSNKQGGNGAPKQRKGTKR